MFDLKTILNEDQKEKTLVTEYYSVSGELW